MENEIPNPVQTCGEWTASNATYHAEPDYVGHSMLEVFRRSPVEYAARYVYRTMEQKDPTPSMLLGTALHAYVLEFERFGELVAVAPDVDRRTKIGKEVWSSFYEAAGGKTVITAEQEAAVIRMAASVRAHPKARLILDRSTAREQAIRWTDSETGMVLKAKPDVKATPLLADLKTAADVSPEGWARQAASLGYHRQTAHYQAGARAVWGEQHDLVHIVVQNCEPWECCCYYLDDDAIQLGADQNDETIHRLKSCFESGDWTEPQNRDVVKLAIPKWAFYDRG